MVSKTVFGQSVKTCRTRVRRFSTDPLYDETFALKAYHQTRTALITVYNWARGVEGRRLGQVEVEVQEPRNRRPRWHRLRDARGRRLREVGVRRVRVRLDGALRERLERALLELVQVDEHVDLAIVVDAYAEASTCLLYTSPSPRDRG